MPTKRYVQKLKYLVVEDMARCASLSKEFERFALRMGSLVKMHFVNFKRKHHTKYSMVHLAISYLTINNRVFPKLYKCDNVGKSSLRREEKNELWKKNSLPKGIEPRTHLGNIYSPNITPPFSRMPNGEMSKK